MSNMNEIKRKVNIIGCLGDIENFHNMCNIDTCLNMSF